MEGHFLAGEAEGEPGFRPEPWYNPHGDCIEYCTVNEGIIADRVDGVITVYRSAVDDRPIGFQIKGVSALLNRLDASQMKVEFQQTNQVVCRIRVSVALTAAVYRSFQDPLAQRRLDRYAELFRVAQQVPSELELTIPKREAALAGAP